MIPGPILGQDRPETNSAKCLFESWAKIGVRKTQPNVCSKRRDSESSTDIDSFITSYHKDEPFGRAQAPQKQRLHHEI